MFGEYAVGGRIFHPNSIIVKKATYDEGLSLNIYETFRFAYSINDLFFQLQHTDFKLQKQFNQLFNNSSYSKHFLFHSPFLKIFRFCRWYYTLSGLNFRPVIFVNSDFCGGAIFLFFLDVWQERKCPMFSCSWQFTQSPFSCI